MNFNELQAEGGGPVLQVFEQFRLGGVIVACYPGVIVACYPRDRCMLPGNLRPGTCVLGNLRPLSLTPTSSFPV